MRKVERSAKTNGSVLPERFGCRVNSKDIVPSWVAGCVAHVLSRSERCNDDHNVRVRLKMRKCRDALTQDGGAVDPGDERGETATLDPGRVTRTSLDRTDANGERPSQRCAASEQWQRGVFTSPSGVHRNLGKLARKPMMGHKKKYIPKSSTRRNGEKPGCLKAPRSFVTTRVKNVERGSAPPRWDRERCGGPSDAIVSNESSRDPSSDVPNPATAGC